VYSAQWANDPLQLYSVRMEFPQSTKLDLPTAALLAMSGNGNLQIALDPVVDYNALHGTLANAQLSGGAPRAIENEVISADYSPDGTSVAVSRIVNGKVQLEYPRGKAIYSTSGYIDYLRVAPNGNDVAFIEHPVFGDDRGWVATVDSSGKHTQLTTEYDGIQGLAWHPKGKEIWYSAGTDTADMQLYAVTLAGNVRQIMSSPQRTHLLDLASDGRVLFSNEQYLTEITALDPATRKERHGLEWFNGSGLQDISPDGKAVLSMEWGGPAGSLYLVVYRKTDGSPPEALGPGALPHFSPDGRLVAAPILSHPPQVSVVPLGAGEGRKMSLGDLTVAEGVIWFPDNKHVLVRGATPGQPLQSYVMDIEGGKPQQIGPVGFQGLAIANDGKRIAGLNIAGQAVVWNKETNQEQPIAGIEHQDHIDKWAKDGQGLLVFSAFDTTLYRIDPGTGKRTVLQKIELADKAGIEGDMSLRYAEDSKTYAYGVRRSLGTLFVVEGLE
jgi:Tol biopolymer transport system component